MEYRTAGESHGPQLLAILSGVPAGIAIRQEDIDRELSRRQTGYGRGGRMAIEADSAVVVGGVRGGRTTGAPVGLVIANQDWKNWTDVMAPFGDVSDRARVTTPRPGHADLPGCMKTGATDVRDVLERASARETAARVAAGSIAKALLAALGVTVFSWVERIGHVSVPPLDPSSVDVAAVESSDVRCPDPVAAESMRKAIDEARAAGESLGGIIAVAAMGAVPGLGGYAEARDRLDGRLAGAVMSIPAIKGVEFAEAFASAALPGSAVHDAILYDEASGFHRTSNRAGGLEGGMTNGEAIMLRAAMKPIPTLMKPLATVDIDTHEVADAARERSDVTAVPAAGIVAEAEVALVLADAYCRKFGCDCMDDMSAAAAAYRQRISR